MRDAQQLALKLPNVGYASNTDHGAGCNIHPPPKQYCGERLGDSALAIVYKQQLHWRSPTFKSATSSSVANPADPNSAVVTVTVSLHDTSNKGMTTDIYPFNYVEGVDCTALNNKTARTCAWAAVRSNDQWFNATVVASGFNLILAATVALDTAAGETVESAAPTGSSYGWGAIPMSKCLATYLLRAYYVLTSCLLSGLPSAHLITWLPNACLSDFIAQCFTHTNWYSPPYSHTPPPPSSERLRRRHWPARPSLEHHLPHRHVHHHHCLHMAFLCC